MPRKNQDKWHFLKKQILKKIKSDPNSPFKKMIDKDDEVILVDKDGHEYKLVPSFIKE